VRSLRLFGDEADDVAAAAGGPLGLGLDVFVAEDVEGGEVAEEAVGLEHEFVRAGEAFDDEQSAGFQRGEQAFGAGGFRTLIPGVDVEEGDQIPLLFAHREAIEIIHDGVEVNV